MTNDINEYIEVSEKLTRLLFEETSPIKADIDYFKDYTAGLSLLLEAEKAKATLGVAKASLNLSLVMSTLNNLKSNLQKVMFITFSSSQTIQEKRQAEYLYKYLIQVTENSLVHFSSVESSSVAKLTHLETSFVSKGLGFIGLITAGYDLFDSQIKLRNGDVIGATYSLMTGTSGLVGIAFPPIGIAGAAADLASKYVINPFIFKSGDNFQKKADEAIGLIYNINEKAMLEINKILNNHSLTLDIKEAQIESILKQKNKLIGNVQTIIENSFKNVFLQLPVYGSYQAVRDAANNTVFSSNNIRDKLRRLKRLNNRCILAGDGGKSVKLPGKSFSKDSIIG